MTLHAVLEIFLWLFGLCAGSFLNVVVYRPPRGLSLVHPPRSFCPRCRAGIAWYDNIPILSWWLLAGRCRHCGMRISVQYPLVEGLTGLAFVLVYHLLFVAQAHGGFGPAHLPTDLPLLLAWLALVGGLTACAALDIVSYTVDIRVTNVLLYMGIVLHALWPRGELFVPRVQTATGAATLAAFLVSGLMLWWTVWRPAAQDSSEDRPEELATADRDSAQAQAIRLGGRFAVLVFLVLTIWLIYAGVVGNGPGRSEMAVTAALLATFTTTVLVGGQQRPADAEIKAAIEEERPLARRTIWREFKWLLPALLAATIVFVAVLEMHGVAARWRDVVGWKPAGAFAPIAGAVFAIHGAIIGAAAGWALRIVFTLVFGREAFGIGDIYILAAAGAAAGWDIALLGLLLSVGIALAGWLLGLLLKSTVMIPFGPWLALGFLLALWWSRAAHRIATIYRDNLAYAWQEQPHLLYMIGGLMLIGTAAAIALARLVRRWVAPGAS